ncbi:AAA family ATPase [Paraburkholderia madseniana]|uniref:AAA family ATPase n=1 Tax=Paraburkholderia madseniana TaxID=2599607 RepID=A0A6N6WLN7_9BURK|nr:YhaN family protein [Paraburkholderia madseniana]KAE8760831.1 AAA family ATPase [Paraburkholderia madseniana]
MRLVRLHLQAFGPFTNRVLDFGTAGQKLVLVHGQNEAGKSSALRSISDLRFGIAQQSKDNFVHAHPDMRIGGVFVDRQGREYSLMRRKGRGATLHFTDFDLGGSMSDGAVPPEVEALLTCGLTKEEYDSMFGLDHLRLREGGEALLKGEGEIGAALFEASAGVRSIPQILDRLEQSARTFFMPGARGKNARINEALNAYDQCHTEYKQAFIRPAQWAELFKKHRAAADEVAALDVLRFELNSTQLLIKELRAVAPLLNTLEHASHSLQALQTVTLLSATATTDRVAAESGLGTANHNAKVAAADAERQRKALDTLASDTAILDVGAAVKRLAASMETVNRHNTDVAEAVVEVATETARVTELAARIDVLLTVDKVLERIPTPAAKVRAEQRLRDVERAQLALDEHFAAARQHSEASDPVGAVLPSPEIRTALRIAQAELVRNDSVLKRLAALPGEIKAARRATTAALVAVGLADEVALQRVRPLLDAQIDDAMNQQRRNATRREERETRIDEVSGALSAEIERRDRLLEQGSVSTPDDVRQARSHRDLGWSLVRAVYIDGTDPSLDAFTAGKPLPEVYEGAVVGADRLVDELTGDTERAAQLQSTRQTIAALERDRDELKRQLEDIGREEEDRQTEWRRILASAQLPDLSPTALRDWQALLAPARTACEMVAAKLDELEQLQVTERGLVAKLCDAILGTGLASPPTDPVLSTLSATAAEIEQEIKQGEKALNTAAGKQLERDQQRQQSAVREAQLTATLQSAMDALRPALTDLLLTHNDSVAVAHARLAEFQELQDAKDRLATAEAKERRAREALSILENTALAIAKTLGDPEFVDIRLYIESLSTRLELAEKVQTSRTLAQNALESALERQLGHEQTASGHEEILTSLCLAAGVESPVLLPEVEEQSRRKREAQLEFDRASSQLAEASRRTVEELRVLLVDHDAARMDADEISCTLEQGQLEEQLRVARESEEAARRALGAIDGADTAIAAREAMERAAASVRANMSPWIRSRVAHALLAEALKRFRDRAQGPMLLSASGYFERMTGGEFVRLVSDDSDDRPALLAERGNGARLRVEGMSEGTRDQLYLALRLAALGLRRASGVDLPVILDDILMTSDDHRAGLILRALADFSAEGQVVVFTHHRHVAEIAHRNVSESALAVVSL